MTADNCIYWSGEGCICEIETGIRCSGMTDDLVSQCNYTNDDLEEIEDD
jgi:hypothetical protein